MTTGPASPPQILIPYTPRALQLQIHRALETHRFGVCVCHRRFGKTVAAVNQLIKAALTCTKPRPRFAYLAPTYAQGKSIAWDYLRHYAGAVPSIKIREAELRIDFDLVGAQVRIYGADNPDSLRGLYLDGVVLDEYGLMDPRIFTEVIRPAISDRQGWALFLGTPAGKNQFYDVVQRAKSDPSWYLAEFKASETGILPADELKDAASQMTTDEYAQEYECSFEASVKGAIFAREIAAARETGRLTRVPYDPALPVDTDWDLGIGDSTAIWFSQSLRSREVRLIDYYEASGLGLHHYRDVLSKRGYTYGTHWAPHDIQVRELGTGNSRLEAARQLGLAFQIAPKVERLEDGIHAARMLLPRCWFDAEHCRRGLEALQHYRWDYNSRIQTFTHLPVHDWASHGADAFRGLAFRHYVSARSPEREASATVRAAQRDRDPYDALRRVPVGRGGY